jgi:hypothetical protein
LNLWPVRAEVCLEADNMASRKKNINPSSAKLLLEDAKNEPPRIVA